MVGGLGVVYTLVTVVVPVTRVSVASQSLRVAVEAIGMCALLAAAGALSQPSEDDVRPSRSAFVAALVVLAIANAVFAIWPAVTDSRVAVDRGLAQHPWMAARYLAGGLFLLAALERPDLGLRLTMAWSLLALVVVEAVLLISGSRIPVPVTLAADGVTIEVLEPVAHVLIQLGSTLLFLAGAWLTARSHRRAPGDGIFWLAIALLVFAFAQVHEILYPAMLGPVMTSADALRVTAFGLLAAGAITQVRRLFATRSRAVRIQQQDLRHQSALVDELTAFADGEQLFRQLVTHELATPLAAIRAHGQVLDRSLPGPRTPGIDAALQSLETESTRLLTLLTRIDELRDVDAAEFRCELRPVRARPLLEEACRFAEALPGAHRVVLRCPDLRVHADPVRVGQLLRNVLGNAVRFSPHASPIRVKAEVVAERLQVTVSDRGPGIPPRERALVLRRNARGSSGAEVGGSGIGLFLAQRIALGHGDDLGLADGPDGVGTAVSFTLELSA